MPGLSLKLKIPSVALRSSRRTASREPTAGQSAFGGGLAFGRRQSDEVSPRKTSVRRRRMILEHQSQSTSDLNSLGVGMSAQQLHAAYDVEEDKILGKGGFGTVSFARLRGASGIVRAVKTVPKRDLKAESLVRSEVDILRRLDHPCICRLFETFEDDAAIYLVLEYINGRELFDEIVEKGQLDEHRSAEVMAQIFSSLQYCHERNVCHRDLKPENIMVCTRGGGDQKKAYEIKLIDFGLAKLVKGPARLQRAASGVIGSVDYLAPEAYHGNWHPGSDIWGAGVIMNCLLTGGLPLVEVREGSRPLDANHDMYSHVSHMAKDLLRSLLEVDPGVRVTAAEVVCHPWLQNDSNRAPHQEVITRRIIQSLQDFHRSEKLRRAALTALAMNLTSEQLQELRETFFAIDQNQDGRISKEEFAQSMANSAPNGGWSADVQQQVDCIFDSIDTDGSQHIEYTEWIAAALEESWLSSKEAMRAAFRVFDVDADGRISADDVARVVKETPEGITGMMPRFDANGDGFIDFDEFQGIFLSEAIEVSSLEQASQPGPGVTFFAL